MTEAVDGNDFLTKMRNARIGGSPPPKSNSSPVAASSPGFKVSAMAFDWGDDEAASKDSEEIPDTLLDASLNDFRVPFDVVLLDADMPNMGGPEAARIIRADGYRGPMIGLTSMTLRKDVQSFIEQGANDVLPKPLNLDSLKRVLSEFYEEDMQD